MIEHFNNIDVYHKQIEALLDLMQCCEDCVDPSSIRTASEMSQTMLDELMSEVAILEKRVRSRECAYCKHIFDCEGNAGKDYCLRFVPQNEDAERRYKEWRSEDANKRI